MSGTGTLDVRVRGDKLFPHSFGGRFSILCAILRQIALIISVGLFSSELRTIAPDVIFVDQLSVCVPFFRIIYPKAKVLFYGHYPDRLLVKRERGLAGLVKQAYRVPFDSIEGWSTGCADSIVVNSKYTRSVFRKTFPAYTRRPLKIVYPCVDTQDSSFAPDASSIWPGKKILLSINRFEAKKDLDLAINAYAGLSQDERNQARLVIAGGFDPMNLENSRTHKGLQALTESLNLTHATFKPKDTELTDMSSDDVDVLFLLSIPQDLKQRLLQSASLLIYTPTNEHFGIVPLEAMLAGIPVLATNTGGPLETIYDGRTGWLRSPEKVEQWTDVMRKPLIPSSADTLKKMGQSGHDRVLAEFSETKMTAEFEQEMHRLVRSEEKRPVVTPDWLYILFVFGGLGIPGIALTMKVMWWAIDLEETKHLARLAEEAAKNATETVTSVVSSVTSSVRDEL